MNKTEGTKKFVCRHCHVEVISKNDFRPKLGKTHAKKCPRRRTLG
jgi:hypothetical protein